MNYIYTRLRIIIQSKEDLIFAKVQTIKESQGRVFETRTKDLEQRKFGLSFID